MIQNPVDMLYTYFSAISTIVLDPLFYGLIATIFILERLWPADRQQRVLSKGMYQDCAWYLLNGTTSFLLIPLYMAFLHYVYSQYFDFLTIRSVETIPTGYRIISAVLVSDFLQWFNHFLRHKVGVFWLFHAVHHSQRELNLFTNHRFHLVDRLVPITIMFVPMFMFGLDAVTNVYIVIFEKWYTRAYHANLRTNFGVLKYFLVTPQSHRIHHSLELNHRDKNFGYIFSIWDRMAGTQYKNYDEYVVTGVDDVAFPVERDLKGLAVLKNLWAQFIYPFRQLNSMVPVPCPAIVIQHYPPFIGGAERQAQLLARLLSAHTIGAEVITTKFRSNLPSREHEGLVPIRRLATTFKGNLRLGVNFLVGFLFFALYGHRYTVVHGHCLSSFVLGALAGAKLRGRKVLLKISAIGEQGEIERLKQHVFGKLFWSLTRRADIFIAQTRVGAAELVGAGLPQDKIRVIPGAVDPRFGGNPNNHLQVEARQALGLPDSPIVLFVGRLVQEKGLDLLLSAWEEIARKSAAVLAMVGDGPEMARIKAMTRGTQWQSSLRLFGWRFDPEKFYRAADIFVFPSKGEAFGNVLAEAMAHGLPIVTTRVGLACDWMRDGESALLISGETPGELAKAIAQLIDDKALRQRLGREAEQLARRCFSSDAYTANHLDLYKAFTTNFCNTVEFGWVNETSHADLQLPTFRRK